MMKNQNKLRRLLFGSAVSLIALPWFAIAGDDTTKVTATTTATGDVKVMRVVGDSKGEHDVKVIVGHASRFASPVEPSTFLGVETMRVSATLTEQLGLDRGIGLIVQRVVEETAAADVLKKHDILTKLDDQLLVSSDQLGVLVRSKETGTEVTLTFFRGGKEQTAKVTLKTRKGGHAGMIHLDGDHGMNSIAMQGVHSGTIDILRDKLSGVGHGLERAEVDRILSSLGNRSSSTMTLVSDQIAPVVRMLNINSGNVVFSDDAGAIELKTKDGGKILIVKSPEGEVIFDGPVNSDEERSELDEVIRLRLEKVEGIETLEFHTDENFEAEDVRILAPRGGSVRVIRRGENHPITLTSPGA